MQPDVRAKITIRITIFRKFPEPTPRIGLMTDGEPLPT
jgi:hypothetical protein